jgi:hypothetical protein
LPYPIFKFFTCEAFSFFSPFPLNASFRKDDYGIFAQMVSREMFPHYYAAITQPTAISEMRAKNSQRLFRNLDEFKVWWDALAFQL